MKQPHSLQLKLITTTLSVLLISALLAGIFAFQRTYEETDDLFDENLENIALAILTTRPSPQSYRTGDSDDGLWVDILDKNHTNFAKLPMGFSTAIIDGERFSVYKLAQNHQTIIVRQRHDSQDELATLAALHSLIPLLIVSGILAIFTPFLMWREFRFVRRATKSVSQRDVHDLSPLPVENFPKEILPFAVAINQLLVKAQEDIDTQKRFIADASHELRSPLTAISLQVQRLQTLTDLDKIKIGLNKLAKSVAQNQDLVEKLLTIARLNGKTGNHKPVKIANILKNSVNLLLPIINEKSLNFEIDIKQENATLLIDETVLLLLIKNIIQNAIIYTPNQGRIAIILSDKKQDLQEFGECVIHYKNNHPSKLFLQIKDSGIGIKKADYYKVFEPFTRLSQNNHSDNSEIKGTGLGLSIVKTVCENSKANLYLNTSLFENHLGGLCVTLAF